MSLDCNCSWQTKCLWPRDSWDEGIYFEQLVFECNGLFCVCTVCKTVFQDVHIILPTSGMTRPVSLCPDATGGTINATHFPNMLKNVSWERGRGAGVLYQKSCRSLYGLVEKCVGNNTDCDFTVVTDASGIKTLWWMSWISQSYF